MTQETQMEKQEEFIASHIFAVSTAMVGVCFTVVGIINVITSVGKTSTLTDELTIFDAILFLAACFVSYTALKTRDRKRRLLLEKIADCAFLSGLAMTVVISGFIVSKLL